MSLNFSVVHEGELDGICGLYQSAIAEMLSRGLKQWEWGVYPTEDILKKDVECRALYRMEEDGATLGAFAICDTQETEYAQLSWRFGVRPATLHRLAMRPGRNGMGLAQRVMEFVKAEAVRLGYDSLRLDTSSENERALRLFRSFMERKAGEVFFDNPNVPFYCFESPLTEDCPMLPISMRPAYRFGEMTPWGGDGLKTAFGRDIPDARTGESLEISAAPGLESADCQGETLLGIAAAYGQRLLGRGREGEFPLMLKLLCAERPLSVQVHPGDDYARKKEGKLGKSEAWVILKAREGAHILYGLEDGVDRAALEAALRSGGDIERLIKRVPVKAGDVFSIPSGMVHAIGDGIMLYEIQQSSDVTYRLWDYDRVGADGKKRPLHIDKALDVIDYGARGMIVRLPEPEALGMHSLLNTPQFRLDCVCVNGEHELKRTPEAFRIVTALAGLLIQWEGDAMELQAGRSALLPASCPEATLTGVGRALIATP